jgi:predicted MFS family arabinose efflux permease
MRMRTSIEIAQQSKRALWASFAIMGIASMGWVARIPEIKDANGLSNAQFGLVLLASALGSIVGAQLAGRLVHTYGSRTVLYVSMIMLPAGLCAIGFSTEPIILAAALFLMGSGYSSTDVALNTQAVAIEKILNARSMSSFHAMWSVGAFTTTVLGGSIARFVSPEVNLAAVAALCVIAFIPSIYKLLPKELDGHQGDEETSAKIPLFGKSVALLWLIGFGVLAALIAEGSASDWGALLLRDDMGVGKGVNASAYASFALAMITARFLGDRALDHFGPARLVRICGYYGALGWGASIAIAVPLSDSNPLIALVIINLGFIIAGLAIGPMFPAFILAASAIPGIAPSVSSARAFVIGLSGFFLGPSIIGFLAEGTSISVAMAFPILSLMAAGFLSRVIK